MFLVHGEWLVSVKEKYVLQWFSGNWNEEASISYCTEFLAKTAELTHKPWAVVSCLDDWELATPEAENRLAEHLQRLKNMGCTKHCQIYTPSAVKAMQLERMCCKNDDNYERKNFEDIASAIRWLKSHGFSIDIDEFSAGLPVTLT